MSYTRESANAILPELILKLEALRAAFEVAMHHKGQVDEVAGGNGGSGHAQQFIHATHTISATLQWLTDKQIILRDINEGLVDFPGEVEGHDAFLCWKLGEPAVDHWHDLDSGYGGRKRFDE